jgi:hypothetical protein
MSQGPLRTSLRRDKFARLIMSCMFSRDEDVLETASRRVSRALQYKHL